jgi:hypothetical protein
MILYVNGSNYSAGAKLVNDFSFANDDFRHVALGLKPHPDNLATSYGMHLSKLLKLALVCGAEANSSNNRILDTTYEYINSIDVKQHTVVIIGWAKIEKRDAKDHEKIFELHQYLNDKNITHLFFNEADPFTNVPKDLHKDWGVNFIEPYTKYADSNVHLFWAQHLFNWLTANKFNV